MQMFIIKAVPHPFSRRYGARGAPAAKPKQVRSIFCVCVLFMVLAVKSDYRVGGVSLLFGFANALLLLLLAAACLDFVPVLRRRLSPAAWWAEERPLFCAHGAAVRQRYGTAVFLLGVMVYEFIVVFNNSMARENWPWLQTRVSPVLDWVMYLCFGCKILLGTRDSGRSLLCAGALYFVARWVYFNGQNIWWLGLCVALLAAKDVPLRRCMKALLACGLPTLALVELLHFAGVIAPDAASERDGSFRLMFGYGHPNTFGGVVFGLVLAWVLLRRARLTWAELAGVAAVGAFLMIGPKSRSAALCSFLLVALLAAAKLRTRRGSRTLAAGCAALVPLLAAVSYSLPLFVVKIGGPDASRLARAGQYLCVSALPDRPGHGRAGLRPDDGGAVRLCPPRSVAGRSLPDHDAGLRLYGESGHPPDQRPCRAAALRCGVCAANRALDV